MGRSGRAGVSKGPRCYEARMPLVLAEAVDPYAFGTRDIVGLVFVGVSIVAIWLLFLHLQGLTERGPSP